MFRQRTFFYFSNFEYNTHAHFCPIRISTETDRTAVRELRCSHTTVYVWMMNETNLHIFLIWE